MTAPLDPEIDAAVDGLLAALDRLETAVSRALTAAEEARETSRQAVAMWCKTDGGERARAVVDVRPLGDTPAEAA